MFGIIITENLLFHFLGFILEPKRSFFSPDLCILITCSSEKCIHINQEVLQALHFLPLVQESVNYFCAKILFSILIFCAADSRLIVWNSRQILGTTPIIGLMNQTLMPHPSSEQIGIGVTSQLHFVFTLVSSIYESWLKCEMWNRSLCNDFVFTQVSLTRRAMSHFSENTQSRSIHWFLNAGCFPFEFSKWLDWTESEHRNSVQLLTSSFIPIWTCSLPLSLFSIKTWKLNLDRTLITPSSGN